MHALKDRALYHVREYAKTLMKKPAGKSLNTSSSNKLLWPKLSSVYSRALSPKKTRKWLTCSWIFASMCFTFIKKPSVPSKTTWILTVYLGLAQALLASYFNT